MENNPESLKGCWGVEQAGRLPQTPQGGPEPASNTSRGPFSDSTPKPTCSGFV